MRILIATDGSPHSEAAVEAVLDRPWPEGTTVRVVTAVPFLYPTFPTYMPEVALAAVSEESRKEAQSIVEAAAARLRQHGFAVETVVREGDARPEIVQEASDSNADLIVVGSHGYTGLRKLLLGSVAQYIVSHAPCSVEVVRRRDSADQRAPSDS
jgi:nucleotide-binding universal stress UspA family protein